jgi:hypothetical protein
MIMPRRERARLGGILISEAGIRDIDYSFMNSWTEMPPL